MATTMNQNYPSWVCSDCGTKALQLPENRGKKRFTVSTFHNGICGVCGQEKAVTEPRDFGYPEFEQLLHKNNYNN